MSLVFAAITPHPPLLIPTVGKEETNKLEKTQAALELLEQNLYIARPHIIVVVSPHGHMFPDAFTINANTHYNSSFKEFGDYSTSYGWKGCPEFAALVGHAANIAHIPLHLTSNERLDHGCTIPLHFLARKIKDVKIVPIGYSELDASIHLSFGKLIREVCMDTDKRVALIASGDMSHGLSTDSPAGFSKVGKEFDEKIISLLETRNTAGIANMESIYVREAAECGYRSLLILLGALQSMDYRFKNYAYESPFGVGYLTGEFVFD